MTRPPESPIKLPHEPFAAINLCPLCRQDVGGGLQTLWHHLWWVHRIVILAADDKLCAACGESTYDGDVWTRAIFHHYALEHTNVEATLMLLELRQ